MSEYSMAMNGSLNLLNGPFSGVKRRTAQKGEKMMEKVAPKPRNVKLCRYCPLGRPGSTGGRSNKKSGIRKN